MEPLPLELEAEGLLAAFAEALAPVTVPAAASAPASAHGAAAMAAPAGANWAAFAPSGGAAAAEGADLLAGSALPVDWPEAADVSAASLDAGMLSREIERDARRYDSIS